MQSFRDTQLDHDTNLFLPTERTEPHVLVVARHILAIEQPETIRRMARECRLAHASLVKGSSIVGVIGQNGDVTRTSIVRLNDAFSIVHIHYFQAGQTAIVRVAPRVGDGDDQFYNSNEWPSHGRCRTNARTFSVEVGRRIGSRRTKRCEGSPRNSARHRSNLVFECIVSL